MYFFFSKINNMLFNILYFIICYHLLVLSHCNTEPTNSTTPEVPILPIVPHVLSTCHDPSTGVQYSRHPKFIIYAPDKSGGGLGNSLVYFANAFFLAAVTGKELIMGDSSGIGQMCHVVNCGYPHLEEMMKVTCIKWMVWMYVYCALLVVDVCLFIVDVSLVCV